MAGLVTRNKIDVSVLSDTTVSVSILFVDLIQCKGVREVILDESNRQGNPHDGLKVKS